MCLAQYREATSDLSEALGFIKTVHADELTGYDGNNVRHIVDTLRVSRPHLYPSTPDLYFYNATPPHDRSLSVPIRSSWNDSERRIAAEQRGQAVDVVDGGGSQAAAGRRSAKRGRRQVEEVVDEPRRGSLSPKYSTRNGEFTVADNVDETLVVVRNIDDDEMTSGLDVEEDRQLADADFQVLGVAETGVQVADERNASATEMPASDNRDVANSSEVVNATLNVTSFPVPPPDATYVETLFKIAHIFHFVGIGILTFFVLQVPFSVRVVEKKQNRYLQRRVVQTG